MREIETLREMTPEELNTRLHELREELFSLRFRHRSQKLPNPLKLRELRRQIALVKTIAREGEQVTASPETAAGEGGHGERP
jgi:large subunit ribosomal protein L29